MAAFDASQLLPFSLSPYSRNRSEKYHRRAREDIKNAQREVDAGHTSKPVFTVYSFGAGPW
jgi:hypothetical protein